MYPGVLLSSLPWWIAAPLIQLAVLVFGMALDETYVNRTTVLTGAIAVQIHGFVAGDVGLLVGLYADIGLLVGAYGVYAYVLDAYVGNAFRLVAFLVYSPLSVFLVILTAGPTLFGIEPLFVPALALAGYGNIRLREYLSPSDPYYFGPESEAAFESAVEATAETDAGSGTGEHATTGTDTATTGTDAATTETDAATPTESDTGTAAAASADGSDPDPFAEARNDGGTDRPAGEPAAAADSSERGILPEFMRRL
ncbi:hypothetical protein ACT4ML_18965 [Natrinema sp. LN54]|uniref:hypothetical protein n=1 Tax=Natrinema sp. LN54 TaxID=3458705 RepID=UPI004036C664